MDSKHILANTPTNKSKLSEISIKTSLNGDNTLRELTNQLNELQTEYMLLLQKIIEQGASPTSEEVIEVREKISQVRLAVNEHMRQLGVVTTAYTDILN